MIVSRKLVDLSVVGFVILKFVVVRLVCCCCVTIRGMLFVINVVDDEKVRTRNLVRGTYAEVAHTNPNNGCPKLASFVVGNDHSPLRNVIYDSTQMIDSQQATHAQPARRKATLDTRDRCQSPKV